MLQGTRRKNPDDEILRLFPNPLYTDSHVYYEEDLEQIGLGNALDDLPGETRGALLAHATTLARIQPALAFHFLRKWRSLLQCMKLEDLGKWVTIVLDVYDSKGLNPAREFILEQDSHPLFLSHFGKGVHFPDVYGVLLNYLRALGRQEVALETGTAHYTDLTTIYLPNQIDLSPDRDLNFLLYKVMVTHKFAQIKLGSFRLDRDQWAGLEQRLRDRYGRMGPPTPFSPVSLFFDLFPDPNLARALFLLADTVRIERWIAESLPGLHRRLKGLKKQLGLKREIPRGLPPKSQAVEAVVYRHLTGTARPLGDGRAAEVAGRVRAALSDLAGGGKTAEEVLEKVAEIYGFMEDLPGPYETVESVPYVGELRPDEAERGRRRRREAVRVEFRQELAKLVCDLRDPEEVRIEVPEMKKGPVGESRPRTQAVPNHLVVDGLPVPVPEGMQKMIEEICEDLGAIPSSYLAVADDMSGHHFRSLCHAPEEDETRPDQAQGTGYFLSEHGEGVHALDEWDYRRQGYRKRWALLRETEASSGGLEFADATLQRYRGMILRIKHQFERIRTGQTLLRRQKDGDNVDFDAAVEAFQDYRAGLCPSERVFVRLSREKRDIVSAFLIDLSGSTSGWINDMERAGLLIMSEAMQVLKDRFAIYGFSGRTRRRCELFRIKGIEEPYGEAVKRRISNLRALEYTRLGPPIRYLTRLLSGVEARTRLLITLSDGKPDDYDGYKGDYGVEDTRQALFEAKLQGVHPFCITIDKAEHSYLSHMYGAANYVFIDDLSKLPLKVPEIYRRLTT